MIELLSTLVMAILLGWLAVFIAGLIVAVVVLAIFYFLLKPLYKIFPFNRP